MTELFLGIISISVLIMAAVQVTVVLMALRATQSVNRLMAQLDRDIRPVLAHLQAIAADAARATSVATAQVERADKLFTDLAARVDETLATVQTTVQSTVLDATRGTGAWLAGLKAAFATLRDLRTSSRRRSAAVEEEDALFIG